MYKNIQRVIWIQEHKRKKREIMQRERHDKFAHRLNDLTLKKVPSGVANCRNLPFGGTASKTQECVFQ